MSDARTQQIALFIVASSKRKLLCLFTGTFVMVQILKTLHVTARIQMKLAKVLWTFWIVNLSEGLFNTFPLKKDLKTQAIRISFPIIL